MLSTVIINRCLIVQFIFERFKYLLKMLFETSKLKRFYTFIPQILQKKIKTRCRRHLGLKRTIQQTHPKNVAIERVVIYTSVCCIQKYLSSFWKMLIITLSGGCDLFASMHNHKRQKELQKALYYDKCQCFRRTILR